MPKQVHYASANWLEILSFTNFTDKKKEAMGSSFLVIGPKRKPLFTVHFVDVH